jgi:hypothetical protein
LSVADILTVTVAETNLAPTALALSKLTVDENVPIGTVVGSFSTTDPNANDTHTYRLVAGAGDTDNSAFTISGNNLRTAAEVDFGLRDSYNIRVRSTDQGGLSVVAQLTITVIEAPPIPNEPFGEVTVGSFEDAGLLGIRTDLVPNALPIVATHVTEAVDYSGYSNPPTYGPHHPFLTDAQDNAITPRATGVYQSEQPDEDLVHNLEHGLVWISYNPTLITNGDLDELEQLVIDGGTNTGVILTPRSANDHAIALASWARLLTLDSYDATQVRNFIETNRGKAPEGFIPTGQKADTAASETVSDGLPHLRDLEPGAEGEPDEHELFDTVDETFARTARW